MLLVGTSNGLLIDGGDRLLPGIGVVHVARRDGWWWAVDDSSRVWREGEVVAHAPPGVRFTCLQPTPDGVWLGADRARLFLLQRGELREDEFFAVAPGRDTWYTPWGGPPAVRSLSYGPDGILYINVHVGGILRYDDTGLAATVDIDSDVHQVLAHPTRGGTVVAASAWGLGYSHNGHDFEFRAEGLAHTYCRAVAVAEDTVVVSASTGPAGTGARVYRGELSYGPLEPVGGGLGEALSSNLDTHCLAAVEGVFYAGHGTTVWRSADQARTWEAILDTADDVTCLA